MSEPNKPDGRYPYTYACDYLRDFGGYNDGGVKVHRSDASQIRHAIADALGMPDEELAKKLADYYLAHKESIDAKGAEDFMRNFLPATHSLHD